MNQYVTGAMIRRLREERKMTQLMLAEKLHVSEKTVSKWETGKGYPDIAILEDLAAALGVSVIELMAGNDITNRNRASDMKKMKFYVCPVCGNSLTAAGEALISCCGVTLPPLEAEDADEAHLPAVEQVEDEYYIRWPHEMEKTHFISFAAAVKDDGAEIVKLYPEGRAECRFRISRTRYLYWYCNRHGLFRMKVSPVRRTAHPKLIET